MQLFVLRHGEAEPHAPIDAERRLTAGGAMEVRQVVQATPELNSVDTVWASPYRRAQQTAAIAVDVLGDRPTEMVDELIPEASLDALLNLLEAHTDQTLLLVSHQPLVGKLVNGLAGKSGNFYSLGTGALASLELSHPALDCGECKWVKQAS